MSDPRSVFGRMRDRPLVYGHRGTRSSQQKPGPPENTLAAMRVALEQGADGVELDVRLCGSGEVIVLHDPDLARMTGSAFRAQSALRAQDATLAQLQEHDLGGRGHQDERVPLLDAAMDLVLEHGAGTARLNVEIKPDVPDPDTLVRAVLACIAVRPASQRARVIVSSFSALICEAVHALHAGTHAPAVAFLFERIEHTSVLPQGSCALHPYHALLDAGTTAQLRARLQAASGGAIMNTWTVNDAARARELSALGVDGIITDDVPTVLAALASG